MNSAAVIRQLAFYDAMVACGEILYAQARSILARPTPAARDHVIVMGERAHIIERLAVEVPGDAGETHAIVVMAREELLEKIAATASGRIMHLTQPAPAGQVHLASVSAAGIAAGPLPLQMLAAIAAAAEDDDARAEVVSVALREDSRRGRTTH